MNIVLYIWAYINEQRTSCWSWTHRLNYVNQILNVEGSTIHITYQNTTQNLNAFIRNKKNFFKNSHTHIRMVTNYNCGIEPQVRIESLWIYVFCESSPSLWTRRFLYKSVIFTLPCMFICHCSPISKNYLLKRHVIRRTICLHLFVHVDLAVCLWLIIDK